MITSLICTADKNYFGDNCSRYFRTIFAESVREKDIVKLMLDNAKFLSPNVAKIVSLLFLNSANRKLELYKDTTVERLLLKNFLERFLSSLKLLKIFGLEEDTLVFLVLNTAYQN